MEKGGRHRTLSPSRVERTRKYSNNLNNLKIVAARQEWGGGKTMNVTIRTTRRHIKVICEGQHMDGGDNSGPTDHFLKSLKNINMRWEEAMNTPTKATRQHVKVACEG